MNGIGDFIQDNWYELGSLIAQFGIVLILFWFGRTWLKLRAASEEQAEPGGAKSKHSMRLSSVTPQQFEPEAEPEPYEAPAFAHASQREPETRVRPYEIPPVFAPPEPIAAGHGGVGRMLSPMPDAQVSQAKAVRQRRERIGILRAAIKWLREPIHTPRRVARPAA